MLLVDDEEGLLITLEANLELEGFEVATANSAKRALELLEAQTFDVVFTDIRMPGMSGVELFGEIRRRFPSLPVILTTAFTVESVIRDALREGAFAMLPKPATVAHVVATLTHATRRPFVLLVDGGADTSTVAALERVGLRIRTANTGEEALAQMRSGFVDVCVMDVGDQGAAIVGEIHRQAPDVTVVVVSIEVLPSLVQHTNGETLWLRKPFLPQDLAEVVAETRGRARRA